MMRRRKLRGVESLESRCLLAGNVNVFLRSGDLFVQETTNNLNQNITIAQTAAGITFASADATTFNGAAGPLLIPAANVAQLLRDDVFVNLKGGNNVLTITGLVVPDQAILDTAAGNDTINVTGAAGVSMRNLDIHTGRGNDQVDIQNLNVAIEITVNADRGNDVIGVRNTTTGRDLELDGGPDNDQILVQATNVGRHLQVQGGDGNDDVLLQGSAAVNFVNGEVSIHTGNGADRVVVNQYQLRGDLVAHTGAGDDAVLIQQGITVLDDLSIQTDGGQDTVVVDNGVIVIDKTEVLTGAGNDNVLLGSAVFANGLTLNAGAGNDAATFAESTVLGRLSFPNIEAFVPNVAASFARPGGVGTVFFLGANGNDLVGVGGVPGANGIDDAIDALVNALNLV